MWLVHFAGQQKTTPCKATRFQINTYTRRWWQITHDPCRWTGWKREIRKSRASFMAGTWGVSRAPSLVKGYIATVSKFSIIWSLNLFCKESWMGPWSTWVSRGNTHPVHVHPSSPSLGMQCCPPTQNSNTRDVQKRVQQDAKWGPGGLQLGERAVEEGWKPQEAVTSVQSRICWFERNWCLSEKHELSWNLLISSACAASLN